jgi:hypothetical protein
MTTNTAVGIFADRETARDAVRALQAAGFTDSQIGLISRHMDRGERTGFENDPTHTHWEEGAGIGAAAGALTGTGLGIAVVAGLIPPLGPVVAGGTLMALLASAGAGATAGTVIGGLIGLGIPEDEATAYETDVTAGRTLITVAGGTRYAEAVEILRRHGATVRNSAAIEAGNV